MKLLALPAMLGLAACAVHAPAPRPASAFDRGSSLQAAQDPRRPAIVASCRKAPPPPFLPRAAANTDPNAVPADPELPATTAIPGVIAEAQSWKVVWSWQGNNVDGPIAGPHGSLLFANNDASNVMQLDPDTGLATILHEGTNAGGAISRSKRGALYVLQRGIGGGIEQLEPVRRMFADTFEGEPLACLGGVLNDLVADARGGVYVAISAAGVFYANPDGVLVKFDGAPNANGIMLSPDEKTLYATNGAVVMAWDVQRDGSLTNLREFGKLRGGRGGDGCAVDSEGRLYVATGSSADVFAPTGEFLGSIPGPRGMHGVVFSGRERKMLFGIVFYGGWGTPGARNQIVAIPMLARGYGNRAR